MICMKLPLPWFLSRSWERYEVCPIILIPTYNSRRKYVPHFQMSHILEPLANFFFSLRGTKHSILQRGYSREKGWLEVGWRRRLDPGNMKPRQA